MLPNTEVLNLQLQIKEQVLFDEAILVIIIYKPSPILFDEATVLQCFFFFGWGFVFSSFLLVVFNMLQSSYQGAGTGAGIGMILSYS